MHRMDDFWESELRQLRAARRDRGLVRLEIPTGPVVRAGNQERLVLCSNDYLGLARHPRVVAAAQEAAGRYGVGSGASRLLSGNSTLHEALEDRLARFEERESALLFSTGYMANLALLSTLVGEGDAIYSDTLNHASLVDGCRLSKAQTFVYRHRDPNHLEDLLRRSRARRRLIVTDGVFSMDGDVAPLPEISGLAQQYGAMVLVDEAHATGVLGPGGRGTLEHFGLEGAITIQMGTLGKALGSFGAYVTGSRHLVAFLVNRARPFMYTTALPPPVLAAALAALEVLQAEPQRRERLWENRRTFVDGLDALGITATGSETPIVGLPAGTEEKALALSRHLWDRGIFAPAIRPPTVPEGTCRVRMTFLATHTRKDVGHVLHALEGWDHGD